MSPPSLSSATSGCTRRLLKLVQDARLPEPFRGGKWTLPEHGLVPVGLRSSCHVFSGESPAHHSVVVVLDASPAQFDVIEAGGVPCLRKEGCEHRAATPTAPLNAHTRHGGENKVTEVS